MSKNEMIPATNYTALKDFNLAEAMASEMNGMDVSFDRVTIPAAGGTTFELPGELPGETDAVKEFTGVILYHHPLFAYYRERFTGGNNAPDCGSYDGVTGVGNPGGVCAQCPLNQFGSGENGGKACKNKRRIFILREGELIPILLTLPTGSMKEFAVYVKRLLAKVSSTMALGAELFLMGYARSGSGFMVGCSLLWVGRSYFQTVVCLRSENHLCLPLGSQPYSTGSCCH